MKNADMPAMPLPLGTETTEGCQGLTKREMMAMHAPEIPGWFEYFWKKKNETNDFYFYTMAIPFLLTKTRYVREITNDGSEAMYFAWRSHYADALLKELECACQKK